MVYALLTSCARLSTWNAILCASGLIVLFSSGQDRGNCYGEKGYWRNGAFESVDPEPGLLSTEGPSRTEGNGGGFLWDCRNDAGMLYEGLTSALRLGQWSIIPQTELPRCVKQFSSPVVGGFLFIAIFRLPLCIRSFFNTIRIFRTPYSDHTDLNAKPYHFVVPVSTWTDIRDGRCKL